MWFSMRATEFSSERKSAATKWIFEAHVSILRANGKEWCPYLRVRSLGTKNLLDVLRFRFLFLSISQSQVRSLKR